MRNLLLLSSSRVPQNPRWLEYAVPEIRSFLQERHVTEAVFVPYAGISVGYDKYVALARPTFERMGFALRSVHEARDPVEAILSAPAICVGGGNTYFLNRMLHEKGLRDAIRRRVLEDWVPYVGWSAGSNVAFGGILTTNDWNIASTTAFQGLGLIEGGLRLNPHYADAFKVSNLPWWQRALVQLLTGLVPQLLPVLKPQGESRDDRINEYLAVEDNSGPVLALYEGAIVTVQGTKMTLGGFTGAKIFRKGSPTQKFEPGADLSFLLAT